MQSHLYGVVHVSELSLVDIILADICDRGWSGKQFYSDVLTDIYNFVSACSRWLTLLIISNKW